MLSSKVRIEFSEEISPGVFSTVAQESGTQGDNLLGIDLGVAVRASPRPLLVLAQAIVDVMGSYGEGSPLFKEAAKYVQKWREYDEATARGAKHTDLPWPGIGPEEKK